MTTLVWLISYAAPWVVVIHNRQHIRYVLSDTSIARVDRQGSQRLTEPP